MSAARLSFALLGAAAIGGALTWFALTGDEDSAPTQPPAPAPTQEETEPAPIATGNVAEPGPAEPNDPAAGKLLLPDGGYAEPLNGVKNPPKLLWNNPEWSPIVRQEHNAGLDWYVHADGTYSTTMMIYRPDLGRADAVSYSLHPRDPVPVAPRTSDLPPGAIIPGK